MQFMFAILYSLINLLWLHFMQFVELWEILFHVWNTAWFHNSLSTNAVPACSWWSMPTQYIFDLCMHNVPSFARNLQLWSHTSQLSQFGEFGNSFWEQFCFPNLDRVRFGWWVKIVEFLRDEICLGIWIFCTQILVRSWVGGYESV